MIDRHTSGSALAIVAVCFILAAAIVAAGRQPEQLIIQSRPLPPVLILPTSAPTVQPTPDTAMQMEIAALKARVAELEAERNAAEPQAVYQEMAAPQATPYTADPQMTYSESGSTVQIDVPADAPRLCDGFGDWRDYDAMYASSPACHKATP